MTVHQTSSRPPFVQTYDQPWKDMHLRHDWRGKKLCYVRFISFWENFPAQSECYKHLSRSHSSQHPRYWVAPWLSFGSCYTDALETQNNYENALKQLSKLSNQMQINVESKCMTLLALPVQSSCMRAATNSSFLMESIKVLNGINQKRWSKPCAAT